MKINSTNPNFLVGSKTGLRLETRDGLVVEFFKGDGVTVVNRDDVPHVEFTIDKKPVSIKIEAKADFLTLMGRLRHTSEYRTTKVDIMEALADTSLSTKQICEAFGAVSAEQANKARVTIPLTERVTKLTAEQRIAAMSGNKSVLKDAAIKRLAKVGEAAITEDPDASLPGAKPANLSASLKSPEEPDDDKLGKEPIDASAKDKLPTQPVGTGNTVAEEKEDDDDDDGDDKDKKESRVVLEDDDDDDLDAKKKEADKLKEEKRRKALEDAEDDDDKDDKDDKDKKEEKLRRQQLESRSPALKGGWL